MAMRRVLLLSGGQLTCYHWRAGALVQPYSFAADEHGLTEFALYLDREPAAPVWLLVDLVEEEFREEAIPHVYAADRRALLRTKATRLFRDARYTHALFQGREPEGRRDDRVLFTALIRPDLLTPWLGQIARHKVPLAGIYSVPLLSDRLLKRLSPSAEHVLLVTLSGTGGLRQTFFHQRQLKLSRLAVMPELETGQFASFVLAEVEKIRRYLNSLRLLSRDRPLEVYILAHGQTLEDLAKLATDSVVSRHHFVDVADLARRLGLKGRWGTSAADPLFVHLLARERPANFYASAEETRYYGMHRGRIGMRAAGLIGLLAGLTWGGSYFLDGVLKRQELGLIDRQIGFYEQRYQRARAGLPPSELEPADLRRVVEAVRTLSARRALPHALMVALSRGLEPAPELRIEEVIWALSADPDAPVERGATGASSGQPGGADGALYQLAAVRGEVRPFDGDYRAAIDAVNAFADRLAALDGVASVRVLRLPLDLSPETSLSGQAERRPAVAGFELRVALDLGRRAAPGGAEGAG